MSRIDRLRDQCPQITRLIGNCEQSSVVQELLAFVESEAFGSAIDALDEYIEETEEA